MTVTFLSMKIEPENIGPEQTVTAISDRSVTIGGSDYTKSLIVMPDMKPVDWAIQTFDRLTLDDLVSLKQYHPGIILLGTGNQTKRLPREWIFSLLENGILVDSMNNKAACGTYNLTVAEDRNPLLALIIETFS